MADANNRSNQVRSLRQQLFVAPSVQGALLIRVMMYCALSSLTTGALMMACQFIDSDTPIGILWAAAIVLGFLVTLPWVLCDAARVSNRMVGLFTRVHGSLRRLADGDQVSPIQVRDGFWAEWIADFNVMVSRVQSRLGDEPAEQDPSGERS